MLTREMNYLGSVLMFSNLYKVFPYYHIVEHYKSYRVLSLLLMFLGVTVLRVLISEITEKTAALVILVGLLHGPESCDTCVALKVCVYLRSNMLRLFLTLTLIRRPSS